LSQNVVKMVNGEVMSDRTYNGVANALMLIGIASALAFDSGKVPHIVAGSVGIVAGVGALLLYFCGSAEAPKKEEVKAAQLETVKAKDVIVSAANASRVFWDTSALYDFSSARNVLVHAHRGKHGPGHALWKTEANAIEAYRRETAQVWLSHYAINHARKLQWQVINAGGAGKPWTLMVPEVELSPNEIAACAVEIILGLAKNDKGNHWEYSMGPKGLRVSARRSSPMQSVFEVAQNDFDFGDFTTAHSDGPDSMMREPS
jgi:hypothetical protein